VVLSKNWWCAVVRMTWSPLAVWTVRSYRSVSWLTRTADAVLSLALPVLVSVDLTLSPGLSELMVLVLPSASWTWVPAVKLCPQPAPPAPTKPSAPPRAPPKAVASARPPQEQSEAMAQPVP